MFNFAEEIDHEDKKFLMSHFWQKKIDHRRNADLYFSILISAMAVYFGFISYSGSQSSSLFDSIFFLILSLLWIFLIGFLGVSGYHNYKMSNHYGNLYREHIEAYFNSLDENLREKLLED